MQLLLNIDSLLTISNKRLCNCADKETIRVWKAVVEAIGEFDKDLAWACVPNGIEKGGCPESFSNCGMCERIINEMPVEDRLNIAKRYDKYNEMRKIVK